MTKFVKLSIIAFVGLIANLNSSFGQVTDTTNESVVIGFRTVYFMNLKNAEDEGQYLQIANVFNNLIIELGYENIRFDFWKVTGENKGKFEYIWESTWPDQATFDEVFENEKFKATLEQWYPTFKAMMSDGFHNRYDLLNK